MSRYIDAEWLIKESMPLSFSVQKWVNEVQIMTAPSIDIVFCEECKKSKMCYTNGEFYRWCSPNIKRVKDNDFCSDGKRKEQKLKFADENTTVGGLMSAT